MNKALSSKKPALIRNCRLASSVEHGKIILIPEGMIKLKGTSIEIVKLVDGKRTVREIVESLCLKFHDADSQAIKKDVIDFLKLLEEKRVLDFLA